MSTRSITWKIDPHSEAKHDILRRYLEAWFPIMASYVGQSGGNRLVYIDGFAGPGRYEEGQDGSPIIAVKTLLGHKQWQTRLSSLDFDFLFVEADTRRADHLRGCLATLNLPPNIHVRVEDRKFEEVLTEVLDGLEGRGRALAPAFVFIDPFGPAGFPMSVVQRVLRYRASETLITLNLNALIQWWLSVPDRHPTVDALFGTRDWRQCLNVPQKEDCLRNLYRQQLEAAGLRVRAFRMENRRDRTSYYLIYATHHPRGLAVMKNAMWSVDPLGGYVYSDVTNPNQPILYEKIFDDMHSANYADELRRTFKAKRVSKRQLDAHTDTHDHYLSRHLTRALALLVDKGKVTPSQPKRGRGWSAETEFTFETR